MMEKTKLKALRDALLHWCATETEEITQHDDLGHNVVATSAVNAPI